MMRTRIPNDRTFFIWIIDRTRYYTKCDRYRYKSRNLDDRTPQRRFLPDREMLPFPGKAKS
ncbi:hypothetical protein [Microcoleus sp. B4-D4]|uniref:hypothetical protein n=1 Tax=Microcoleus sp. B4-D4 TaxID=2818667 RepID=UPI002FD05A39